MMTLNDYKVHDIVLHTTPSGIKYIGVVKGLDFKVGCLDIAWFATPSGKYFTDAPSSPDRIEWIGHMPEGAHWDGTL